MSFTIPVEITPHAAARLVIQNSIRLAQNWCVEQSQLVVNELATMPIQEIIDMIDNVPIGTYTTNEIPQFGSASALVKVPFLIHNEGSSGLNYAQLGYMLKKDLYAKMDANIKFGENHGKGATLLGLVTLNNGRFYCSSLTAGFCSMKDEKKQSMLIKRLYFRIPIVQAILKEAKTQSVNGYSFMSGMTISTQKRRGQCLRGIFREFAELNIPMLTERISKIHWEIN